MPGLEITLHSLSISCSLKCQKKLEKMFPRAQDDVLKCLDVPKKQKIFNSSQPIHAVFTLMCHTIIQSGKTVLMFCRTSE